VSTVLATTEVARLAKLIRLIFSTNQTGEAAAAVDAVKRLLASENVDAHWLADRLALGAAPVAVTPNESSERDDRSAAWFCFHRRGALSPKENAFITNIVERAAPLSVKQRKWLFDIVGRLEGA